MSGQGPQRSRRALRTRGLPGSGPFTGPDTLPSLGVVLLSLGVLLEDCVVVIPGLVTGVAAVALELALGSALVNGIGKLL